MLLLLEPPEYVETAKVFDMLLAVPKYGRVKVNKVLQVVPDLAFKDHRGSLGESARRAHLDVPPLEFLPLPGKVFVITGPSGVGKGTLIRKLLERMPELELAVSATTRVAAAGGGARRGTTTSSTTRSSIAASSRGTSSSTPNTPAVATGRCDPSSRSARRDGASVVLEIEIQGARQVERVDARGDPNLHRAAVGGDAAHAADRPRHRRPGVGRAPAAGGQGRTGRLTASSRTSSTTTASRTAADTLEQIVRDADA